MTVSLWLDTAAWPGEVDHERITADVAVVGGGVVGATLATLLVAAGRDVVVLEAGRVGGGASGRNAGHCLTAMRSSYHHVAGRLGRPAARALRRASMENREFVHDLVLRFGVPHERRGSQCLGSDADDGADLAACVRALHDDGFDDVEFTDGDPTGRGFVGRLLQPGDMWLQPHLLVTRMMAASGARVLEDCAVRAIDQTGGTVTVQGRRATVDCATAILATNGYSRSVHEFFRDKVVPTRGQMLVTGPADGPRVVDVPTGTNRSRAGGGVYFRQQPDGRFVIGGFRGASTDDESTSADETNGDLQATMHAWLVERYPEVAHLAVTHRWAGIMGFTPDGLPLVGRLPDMPGVYFAVGFNGAGMSFGPLAARMTVDYVVDGTLPGPFHVDRLA